MRSMPIIRKNDEERSSTSPGFCLRELFIPALIALLIALLHYPGAMTNDSYGWLLQARSRNFADIQPLGTVLLLIPFDALYPGPMPFVLLNCLLVSTFTYLILIRSLGTRRSATIALLMCLLYPPILGIMGVMWRDQTGLGLTLATLWLALQTFDEPAFRRRMMILAAVVAVTIVGCLLRYNHPAGALPFVALALWPETARLGNVVLRAAAAFISGAIIVLFCAVLASKTTEEIVSTKVFSNQAIMNYMIARISQKEQKNLFPTEQYPNVNLDAIDKMLASDTRSGLSYANFFRTFSKSDNSLFPRVTNQEDFDRLRLLYQDVQHRHIARFFWVMIEDALVVASPWTRYSGSSVVSGFANVDAILPASEINFSTKPSAWAAPLKVYLKSANGWLVLTNPLYSLTAATLAILPFAWILWTRWESTSTGLQRTAVNASVCAACILSAWLHFLSVVIFGHLVQFRWVHQPIFLSILCLIVIGGQFLTLSKAGAIRPLDFH